MSSNKTLFWRVMGRLIAGEREGCGCGGPSVGDGGTTSSELGRGIFGCLENINNGFDGALCILY